jgi:hypothetical protein
MARANYVPNAIRAHITGASLRSSTKAARAADHPELSVPLATPVRGRALPRTDVRWERRGA